MVDEGNADHFEYQNTEIWIFDNKGVKANYLADILGVDEDHIKFDSRVNDPYKNTSHSD